LVKLIPQESDPAGNKEALSVEERIKYLQWSRSTAMPAMLTIIVL